MSAGPIEFASDGPVDEKGPTEYGGRAGLIDGADVGRELTGSEKRGIIVRGRAVEVVDPVTGLAAVDEGAMAIDHATGLVVDPEWNQDGNVVKPVDAPPRTGDPSAAEL